MDNTLLTLKTIAREALPRLIENLVFPNLVYKDFKEEFSDYGNTIKVRLPVVLKANEFDPEQGVNYENMEEKTVDVALDKIATVDASATAIETAVGMEDLNRVFIEPAAAALAEKINNDGLQLYKDIYNMVGSAGATPSTLADLANVRKELNKQKVPVMGRVALWDPEADANFSTLDAIVNAEKSGSTLALREGSIGRVMGLDNYMAQGVKAHQTGITAGTGVKVNGAVQAGATTLNVDGTTLTGKLVKGDLLAIAGKMYTVTEDSAVSSANAIADIKVSPSLPQLKDNENVTLTPSHTANLAFNPMAFAFVTRPLHNPDGEGVMSYVTNFNGISLRVTKGYDQKFKKSMYSMDVLYGYKTIYPELALRVLG